MLNLRQMEAFRAVMLTGTTIRAAAMLKVTQPAVSRLISDLEAQAGILLFDRTQGRLRPTPEAETLFDEIERAYVSLDHIANFMKGINRSAGRLRLLATMPMSHGILPTTISRFRAMRPQTVISMRTVIRRDVRAWLDTQQFDLALTNFPVDYPLAATSRLVKADGVCILPTGHPLTARDRITAKDIADEPFIAMSPETQHRLKVDGAFADAKIHPRIAIEAQTGIIICEFVAAGLGVSVVDPITARAFAVKGLEIRPFEPKVIYEFRLVFPIQKSPSRDSELFKQIVIDYVKELGFLDTGKEA
jgi:DNA-binding transcriptional LysR family regulator